MNEIEVTIARIDERLKTLESSLHFVTGKLDNGYITRREYMALQKDVLDLIKKIDGQYVTQKEFLLVRRVVYGATGLILSFVLTASLTLLAKNL